MAGKPNGRPPLFSTPEELQKKWDNYVEYCSNPIIKQTSDKSVIGFKWINKTGFIKYAKLHNNFYNDYKKREGFSEVLENIENDCKNYLLEMGLNGFYNSNIVKLIASAHYGLNERTEQNINANVNVKTLRDSIIDEIEKE